MSVDKVPMLVATDAAGGTSLRAPKVGYWSVAIRDGSLLEPGSTVGRLTQLRRRFALVVPQGVEGRVVIAGPLVAEREVEYGEVLLRVVAFSVAAAKAPRGSDQITKNTKGGLQIVAPTDGVFYRASAIGARPYVVVGDRVTRGQTVGLIEVMKTFNPIAYDGVDLPGDAEVVEVLVSDETEVGAGQPLVVVKTL